MELISGQKVNELTLIDSFRKDKQILWNCICSCGKSCVVLQARIKNNHTKSCGCLVSRKLKERNKATIGIKKTKYGANFGHIRYAYSNKGQEYSISDDELFILLTANCSYCGTQPSNIQKDVNKLHQESFVYNGIDRIDNNKGYIEGNITTCCKRCNIAKNNMSFEDFKEHVYNMYHVLFK